MGRPLKKNSKNVCQSSSTTTKAEKKASLSIEQLIQTCPFDTEDQKRELYYVLTPVSDIVKGKKPTEDQLKQLKDKKNRKKKLLNESSRDVQRVLGDIFKC